MNPPHSPAMQSLGQGRSSSPSPSPRSPSVARPLLAHSRTPAASQQQFAQFNQLKEEFNNLQTKHENAQLLIHSLRAQLSQAQATNRPAPAPSPSSSSSAPRSLGDPSAAHALASIDAMKLEIDTHQQALRSSADLNNSLHASKLALESQLNSARSSLAQAASDGEAMRKRENELNKEVEKLKEQLANNTSQLTSLSAELSAFRSFSSSSARESFEKAELQAALMAAQNSQAKQMQAQANELQACKQFIEELKSEFASSIISLKNFHDADRSELTREKQRIEEKLAEHIEKAHIEAVNAQSEQNQILSALQEQFDLYRETAEHLFAYEAGALKEKLERQREKFEQEIKLLVKTKDEQFHRLMLAKDAKILALIEGTEMQKLLMKHESELENVEKAHANQIETVRQEARNEQRMVIEELRGEIRNKELEIEKFQSAVSHWESRLESTMALLRKQKKIHLMKEEQNDNAQKELMKQLTAAHGKIEELIQVKENLRHRILRLRLQIEGGGGESIQDAIKRITKDSARLNTEMGILQAHYAALQAKHERSEQRLAKALNHSQALELEVASRGRLYAIMVNTFQAFLSGRVKGIANQRDNLYNGRASELIEEIQQLAATVIREPAGEQQEHKAAAAGAERRRVVLEGDLLMDRRSSAGQTDGHDRAHHASVPSSLVLSDPAVRFDRPAIRQLRAGMNIVKQFRKISHALKQEWKAPVKQADERTETAAEAVASSPAAASPLSATKAKAGDNAGRLKLYSQQGEQMAAH